MRELEFDIDTLPVLPSQDMPVIISGSGALPHGPGIIRRGVEVAFGVVHVIREQETGRPVARQAVRMVTNLSCAAGVIAAIEYYAKHNGLADALADAIDQAHEELKHTTLTAAPGDPGGPQ